ncbi:uncharacterized protein LOC124918380 isoform X3 [Impatiens glandulifera]|uniref:uncharacterized protein LOC124918380 isoform X3 n=1 Tax=Impatiens glandulifera TaxID=253017 RepID=UPI001FB0E351|nr:uncharacterized protein LOC124918380 isoform X3 [Impatiens glandulifera]
MSSKPCEECNQKCKLHQGNSPNVPDIISFFKVMFDTDSSKILFLPPKVARKVTNLVDKEIQLEDVNKQICKVVLSIVDGKLAFQEGWNDFWKKHNLKIGDLLVFKLKQPCRFLIKVFDQSGCPKLIFSKNDSNKRKRPNDPQAHTSSAPSKKRNSAMDETNVSIPVDKNTVAASGTKLSDDVIFMLYRDAAGHNEDVDQRISLFDLSSFEQQKSSTAIEQQAKKDATTVVGPCSKLSVAVKTSRLIDNNTDKAAIPANANYSKKLEECKKTPSTIPAKANYSKKLEESNKKPSSSTFPATANNSIKLEVCNKTPSRSIDTLRGNALTSRLIGNNNDNAAIPSNNSKKLEECNKTPSRSTIPNNSKKLEECNKTPLKSTDTLRGNAQTRKEDPVQAIDNNIVTGEDKNEVFRVPVKREPESSSRRLEELPIPTKEEGKQIKLRGFDGKLWPVFYTNTNTMGNGWNEFTEANNIGPNEFCVFKSDSNPDIYSLWRGGFTMSK